MAPRVLARCKVTADAPEEKQMHGLRKQRRGVHRELTCQKKKGGGVPHPHINMGRERNKKRVRSAFK
jgi:hypothetical protein